MTLVTSGRHSSLLCLLKRMWNRIGAYEIDKSSPESFERLKLFALLLPQRDSRQHHCPLLQRKCLP